MSAPVIKPATSRRHAQQSRQRRALQFASLRAAVGAPPPSAEPSRVAVGRSALPPGDRD